MHVTRHNITVWQREMSVVLQQRIPTSNIITSNILCDSVLRAVEIYCVKNRNIYGHR